MRGDLLKMKKRIVAIAMLSLILVLCLSVVAFATNDVGDEVAEGLYTAIATIRKIINPIAIIAVIGCGVYCIAGGDPTYLKKAKTWAISIFIGLVVINLAPSIVEWASSIGK